jgi:beta-lactam-binding protein with PASTA domain
VKIGINQGNKDLEYKMQNLATSYLKRFWNSKFLSWILIILICLGILSFIMDMLLMPLYTKHGKEYELPDVTDKPVDEAVDILKQNGFYPIIKDSVYDEHFSPGSVIQQNPLSYSLVKKGRRVYLVVSIGEKPIYMPKLIGLTPQDAEFKIKEANLVLNQVIYDFSDFYHRGVVINQSVPAGDMVEKNKRINITVSLGPAPTSMEVPNLIGRSIQAAQKELDVVGIRVGHVKRIYRPRLVPGTVVNQSISAGTNATKVDSINLLISTDKPPVKEEKLDSLVHE